MINKKAIPFKKIFYIFLFLFLNTSQTEEAPILITKKTKRKLQIEKETSKKILYKKNEINFSLIKEEENSNFYSSAIYNIIKFEIPKNLEIKFFFNGDCTIPIVISTDPSEFSKSVTFSDGGVNLFFNDIGISDFRNLKINEFQRFEKVNENFSSVKNLFAIQEIKSFDKLHRGVIYCYEFKGEEFKSSISFEASWKLKIANHVENELEKNSLADESEIEDENVLSNVPVDKAKEIINGNNIDLDFFTGSSFSFYENIFEINGSKIFNLKNLKEFSKIDIQDLKDNDLEITFVYNQNGKSITETETKKRSENSFQDVKNIFITVSSSDLSSSLFSFKVNTEEETPAGFWKFENIITISVVCTIILIVVIFIIIFFLFKKKQIKDKKNQEDERNQEDNEDTENNVEIKTKTAEKEEFIPVFQLDLNEKNYETIGDDEKYLKREKSNNSIVLNKNGINYPSNTLQLELKKDRFKKKKSKKEKRRK